MTFFSSSYKTPKTDCQTAEDIRIFHMYGNIFNFQKQQQQKNKKQKKRKEKKQT